MLQKHCMLNFRLSHAVAAAEVLLVLNNPFLLKHEDHNSDEAPLV
jgi:hypothetical protein